MSYHYQFATCYYSPNLHSSAIHKEHSWAFRITSCSVQLFHFWNWMFHSVEITSMFQIGFKWCILCCVYHTIITCFPPSRSQGKNMRETWHVPTSSVEVAVHILAQHTACLSSRALLWTACFGLCMFAHLCFSEEHVLLVFHGVSKKVDEMSLMGLHLEIQKNWRDAEVFKALEDWKMCRSQRQRGTVCLQQTHWWIRIQTGDLVPVVTFI